MDASFKKMHLRQIRKIVGNQRWPELTQTMHLNTESEQAWSHNHCGSKSCIFWGLMVANI